MMNPMSMMKNIQQMQAKMQALQTEMEAAVFQGQAAGGLVTVEVTGKFECKSVKIDKSLADPEDMETLEDAVQVAINDAVGKSTTTMATKMSAITGGMKIPGIN